MLVEVINSKAKYSADTEYSAIVKSQIQILTGFESRYFLTIKATLKVGEKKLATMLESVNKNIVG